MFKPQSALFDELPKGRPLDGVKDLPQPFVIKGPREIDVELLRGSRIQFDLVALGPSLPRIMRAIEAIGKLGPQGLDVRQKMGFLDRSQFVLLELRDLLAGGRSLYGADTVGRPMILDSSVYTQALTPRRVPSEAVIEFVTPVVKSKAPDGFVDAYHFTSAVVDRIGLLWQVYGNDWPDDDKEFFSRWRRRVLDASKRLRVADSRFVGQHKSRFSKKQKQTIPIRGFTGTMRIQGDMAELFGLYLLGEVFHIGEDTSSGFGCYKMVWLS